MIARYEEWVFESVRRLRDHPAVAGYYGCDDCCHTGRGTFCALEYRDWQCKQTDAYERDWANRLKWLDAAATAGVHVLVWVGVDHLSSCRSGWIDSTLRPTNVNGFKHGSCFINGVP